nr:hypothetical protein K-LCC10_0273 [Kaumoebavirus]
MISNNISEYIKSNITGHEYSCYICHLSYHSREGLEAHLAECQKYANEEMLDDIKEPMIIWEGEDQIIANGREATVVSINAANLPPLLHLHWNDDPVVRKYCRECTVFVAIGEFHRKATIDGLSEVCKLHEEETPMPEELRIRQKLLEKMLEREKERNKIAQVPVAPAPLPVEPAPSEIKKEIKKYLKHKHQCEYCHRTFTSTKYSEPHEESCAEIFENTGLRWNSAGTFTFKGETYTIVKIYTGRTRNKFTTPHVMKEGITYKYCDVCLKWLPLKKFKSSAICWDKLQYNCKECKN